MKKLVLVISLFTYQCSQTSINNQLQTYRGYDERKLCMSYLQAPSYNIWQEERLQVINEKNFNCEKYVGEAQLRLQQRELTRQRMSTPTCVSRRIGDIVHTSCY